MRDPPAAKPEPVALKNFCYSRALWQQCRGPGLGHVQHIERVFRDMIEKRKPSLMLPVMHKDKRSVVHELGHYYNINVKGVDKEPNRSCFLKLSASSYVPRQVCSEWCRLSPDPDVTAEARLVSHPHLALLFPRVTVEAGPADFNVQFAGQAGRVLILYRKPIQTGDGPVRDVLAVFITERSFSSAKRRGKYTCVPYATPDEGIVPQYEATADDVQSGEVSEDDEESEGVASPSSQQQRAQPGQWDVCEKGPVVACPEEKISHYASTTNQFSALKQTEG
eukprot:TRINITY_DN7141_c0_g1_i2.p1 TRINITY_DN7141_c0_g1~~TRINITY_DN7141_c0_g1_i2.p1  ORF type:complete len:292 (+),score=87.87 TRINITY_DN7141_c0_g1_i2:41-877(+)